VNRLQKYVERAESGRSTGRIAYVLNAEKLPRPPDGCVWRLATNFNAAEEVLEHPQLKETYKEAIASGFAVVGERRA
jgi:hypothetical protein